MPTPIPEEISNSARLVVVAWGLIVLTLLGLLLAAGLPPFLAWLQAMFGLVG